MRTLIQINRKDQPSIDNQEMTLGEYLNLNLNRGKHQRTPCAWKLREKQDLIITAIAKLGVPSFFIRNKVNGENVTQSIEDGLQRTYAFMNFVKGKIVLPKGTILQMPDGWTDPDAPPVDPDVELVGAEDLDEGEYDASGKTFSELPAIVREQFYAMPVTVSYMNNFSDAETRDFFQKLQQGTPLNATEKRNATHRSISDLLTTLTGNDRTTDFFIATGTRLTQKQRNLGKADRMNDREQAIGIMTIINADADNLALTAKTKKELAERGITRNSEEFALSMDTVEVLSEMMTEMDEETQKLVKKTVVPPLARVVSERLSAEEEVDSTELAHMMSAFLSKVADTNYTDDANVNKFRNASVQGANSNPQMQRRVEVLRDKFVEHMS